MASFDRGFKAWAERIAVSVRKELDIAPYQALPPTSLANHLDIVLQTPNDIKGMNPSDLRQLLTIDKDGWSALTFSVGNNHTIIYNPAHSIARQSSDIMHELSHVLAGHEQSRMVVSHDGKLAMRSFDQKQEDEAAWLSSCLLLPRDALIYIKRKRLQDRRIQEEYQVSRQLLEYRLNVSGVNFQATKWS